MTDPPYKSAWDFPMREFIADRWGFCESHMGEVPEGETMYEIHGGYHCARCKELVEKRTERKECGAVTSKPHPNEKKKQATRKSP